MGETTDLFRIGFSKRTLAELAQLLSHTDQRVRLEAQFALAEQGALETFVEIALVNDTTKSASESMRRRDRLARLHAIWGIGQIGRRTPSALAQVLTLLKDADAEIRAQSAKILGEGIWPAPAAICWPC